MGVLAVLDYSVTVDVANSGVVVAIPSLMAVPVLLVLFILHLVTIVDVDMDSSSLSPTRESPCPTIEQETDAERLK